jgi:hypothetical protein
MFVAPRSEELKDADFQIKAYHFLGISDQPVLETLNKSSCEHHLGVRVETGYPIPSHLTWWRSNPLRTRT